MQYVQNNESTKKIKIVNVKREGSESNDSLIIDLKVLDRAYPEIAIEFIELEGVLDPKSSMNFQKMEYPEEFHVYWFSGDRFSYRVAELGGVRLLCNFIL
jgi:hypothetical protein